MGVFRHFCLFRRISIRSFVLACAVFLPGIGALAASAGAHADVVVVLNSRDASVTILDQKTGREVRTQEVGKEPHHLYPTPDGKSLIVANAQSDDLIFLDPVSGDFQRRVKGIPDPYHLGFSPDNKWFVVNSLRLDRVDIYRIEGEQFKLIKRVPTGRMPSHMVFSSDSKFVYVTLQGGDELLAIDLESQAVAWKMLIGDTPAGLWVSPEGLIFAGIMGKDFVDVIDPIKRQIVKQIKTGKGAHAFRGAGDGKRVFVSNREANTISVIDMQKLEKLHDLPAPGGPDCMELTADGRQLWVTSRWIKKVTVIDTQERKVLAQYPVGRSPHGLYFHNRAAWK
jgi:YVTN family beta-propeller protein